MVSPSAERETGISPGEGAIYILGMGENSSEQVLSAKYRSLTVAVSTTGLALLPTAYVALTSNATVLYADFIRSAAEFIAIVISWFVVRRLAVRDGSFYDYGFGKWEQVASLAVASAMLLSFVLVLGLALARLYEPQTVVDYQLGLLFGTLSVAGNVAMWAYNARISRIEKSPLIESQSRLFRAKAVASLVVVIALILGQDTHYQLLQYADPIGACIVAGFLLHSAITLFSASMQDLLDRSIDEVRRLAIYKILVTHESQYDGLRSLRTRRSGMQIYVDLTLEFNGTRALSEVSTICDHIGSAIETALPRSVVTVAPRACA